MATSVVTQSSKLSIVAEFTDDDTRTLTLDNPKSTLTAEDIQTAQTAASKILIGDKQGAPFYRFKDVNKIETVTTKMTF